MKYFVILLLLTSPLAAMNGYSQIGWGSKSRGMGGVGVAYPQEAFAVAHNPAGMVCLGSRIDVALEGIYSHAEAHERSITGALFNDLYATSSHLFRPSISGNYRCSPCLSLGAALYRLGGYDVDYGTPLTQLSALQILPTPFVATTTAAFYEVYLASISLSYRLTPAHALGASLNMGLSWTEFQGLQMLDNPANSAYPGHVTNRGIDFSPGCGFSIGWIGKITSQLWLGASYRSKTWMRSTDNYEGLLTAKGRLDIPAQWGMGLTYKPTCRWAIVADLTRIMWSDTKCWRADQVRTGLYGSEHGRGFGWKDQWAAKVGFAYDLFPCLTLRGGWNYGDIQTGGVETLVNSINQAVIEHHFTGGITYKKGPFEFSLAYIHSLFHNVALFDADANRWDKLKSEQKILSLGLSSCF
ncbi:MAG: outer membrane protein transport protein [Verrucomicrobia bacterium]|nr:outer membrane protein transport protein [Verrucomicrobiota bacterium]